MVLLKASTKQSKQAFGILKVIGFPEIVRYINVPRYVKRIKHPLRYFLVNIASDRISRE